MNTLFQGDCLDVLSNTETRRLLGRIDCIMADPPDNIGLGYQGYKDTLPDDEYVRRLGYWVRAFIKTAPIVWISFNARWVFKMGRIVDDLLLDYKGLEAKPCVQIFTFGQHRNSDLGNNHRPLWRLKRQEAQIYPDQIRVPSWRQRNGDKRASPKGRIPGDAFDHQYPGLGDVMDFPRVTGNSKQRCDWHPTQRHEGLVERCIKLSTQEGDHVLDPFGGTGTTLRVCEAINRRCSLIEIDPFYCTKIRESHANLGFSCVPV